MMPPCVQSRPQRFASSSVQTEKGPLRFGGRTRGGSQQEPCPCAGRAGAVAPTTSTPTPPSGSFRAAGERQERTLPCREERRFHARKARLFFFLPFAVALVATVPQTGRGAEAEVGEIARLKAELEKVKQENERLRREQPQREAAAGSSSGEQKKEPGSKPTAEGTETTAKAAADGSAAVLPSSCPAGGGKGGACLAPEGQKKKRAPKKNIGAADADGDAEFGHDSATAGGQNLGNAALFLQGLEKSGMDFRFKKKQAPPPPRAGESGGGGGRKKKEDGADVGSNQSTSPTTTVVLKDDVFYGRHIMKIPRRALLSLETTRDTSLREELQEFFETRAEKEFNITGEEAYHLLQVALPLLSEMRYHRETNRSVHGPWLEAVKGDTLFVLELTERQLAALDGTTVEGSQEEMMRSVRLILHTAQNFSSFRETPVSFEEAKWALSVTLRRARVVHPHQDRREDVLPRMYLIPLLPALEMGIHPDLTKGTTLQEEVILDPKTRREEDMVVMIARRDIAKGEEIFLWPGRLSNSEMLMRFNQTFPGANPIGIGRNITQPPNWSPNKKTPVGKEYAKFNCTSLESFEMRFSPKGWPMRDFVRCWRVSWFLANGWYNPSYAKKPGILRNLEKWPPPKKYDHDDWLSWTQADNQLNSVIRDYCEQMKAQLKDTMTAATAADFRGSEDPTDKLIWQLRVEETKTFKECISLANYVKK